MKILLIEFHQVDHVVMHLPLLYKILFVKEMKLIFLNVLLKLLSLVVLVQVTLAYQWFVTDMILLESILIILYNINIRMNGQMYVILVLLKRRL